MSESEVQDILDEADDNGDGRLDYEEVWNNSYVTTFHLLAGYYVVFFKKVRRMEYIYNYVHAVNDKHSLASRLQRQKPWIPVLVIERFK